jgi:hypothetical protein
LANGILNLPNNPDLFLVTFFDLTGDGFLGGNGGFLGDCRLGGNDGGFLSDCCLGGDGFLPGHQTSIGSERFCGFLGGDGFLIVFFSDFLGGNDGGFLSDCRLGGNDGGFLGDCRLVGNDGGFLGDFLGGDDGVFLGDGC